MKISKQLNSALQVVIICVSFVLGIFIFKEIKQTAEADAIVPTLNRLYGKN